MSNFDRKDLVSLAKISYDIGLYSDSIDYMKQVIKMSTPLNKDERNLLFFNYMEMIRHLEEVCQEKLDKKNVHERLHSELLDKVNLKHGKICDEAIELLDSYWIKRDKNLESVVDYNHFKVTQHYDKLIFNGRKGDSCDVIKAIDAFEKASKKAEEFLSPNDVVRLNCLRQLRSKIERLSFEFN